MFTININKHKYVYYKHKYNINVIFHKHIDYVYGPWLYEDLRNFVS